MQWTVALPRGTLQTDMVERLLLRVPEAAEALGLSRAKTYQLVAGGEPSVDTQNRQLIDTSKPAIN